MSNVHYALVKQSSLSQADVVASGNCVECLVSDDGFVAVTCERMRPSKKEALTF